MGLAVHILYCQGLRGAPSAIGIWRLDQVPVLQGNQRPFVVCVYSGTAALDYIAVHTALYCSVLLHFIYRVCTRETTLLRLSIIIVHTQHCTAACTVYTYTFVSVMSEVGTRRPLHWRVYVALRCWQCVGGCRCQAKQ